MKIHTSASLQNPIDQVAQEAERPHGDIDLQKQIEQQPHAQRHQQGDQEHLQPLALADEDHNNEADQEGIEHIAQRLEQRNIGDAKSYDKKGCLYTFVFQKIEACRLFRRRRSFFQVRQIPD